MRKANVSLSRIMEILDTPVETDEPTALRPPLDRDIVFDHVSFSYGGQQVLKDLSFAIKSGATFRRIDRHYLRRGVGLVLQEPFLFSKSLFENIDIAAGSEDLGLVRKNAEIAAVDSSIMSFSHGYETLVGERGVTLSGGQKQRVAIARTLMTNAPIMIFDDSMSSVDMETDAKIRQALRENTAGATVILISHRISTLMHADTILVLENGRIAELGSHGELLGKNGIYKRVYDLQSAADLTRGGEES
jgi:ATP-binding cassette subfamily B protein